MIKHGRTRRSAYAAGILACALLGIGSRRVARRLPGVIAAYAGDTTWALAAFLGVGLIWPALGAGRRAAMAAGLALAVELSQLYHAPWIDALRHTPPLGLILGYDFAWSDLGCYALGIALGALLNGAARSRPGDRPRES